MNELNNTNITAKTEIPDNSTLNDEEFLSDNEETEETEEAETDTEPEKPDDSADKKKAEHEAAEAKRKADWEENQKKKKAETEKLIAEIAAMSDDDIMKASIKKTGDDIERLTRRNMKLCVNEHIQTLCLDSPEFARKTMHPKKNMINCFKYINQKAQEYLKQEMEMNNEKPEGGGYGGDIPDDFCYKWAEDYFNDPDTEVDKDKDDKFAAKPYYGGSFSSKNKKKETPKTKTAVSEKSVKDDSEQIDIFGGDGNENK